MSGRRILSAPLLAICLLCLHVPIAAATFHLMQIREVYPGSVASPNAEYVELQMWSGGQNHVGGHVLRTYDAGGGVVASSAFPADVANGANQSTLLLATPEAEAQFGVIADAPLAPSGQLSPAGGAVCWETIDCVAWGNFSGNLPSPAGVPAAATGIPDGMALRRSIVRACPTALDFEDDRNDGSDFEAVFPAPRPNSVPASEHPCSGPAGGSGPPVPSGQAPQTRLHRKPPKRTVDRTPTFRFTAGDDSPGFQCRLDRKRFRRCRSPFTSPKLSFGAHRFQVRAVDADGRADPSPASYRFRVVRP